MKHSNDASNFLLFGTFGLFRHSHLGCSCFPLSDRDSPGPLVLDRDPFRGRDVPACYQVRAPRSLALASSWAVEAAGSVALAGVTMVVAKCARVTVVRRIIGATTLAKGMAGARRMQGSTQHWQAPGSGSPSTPCPWPAWRRSLVNWSISAPPITICCPGWLRSAGRASVATLDATTRVPVVHWPTGARRVG